MKSFLLTISIVALITFVLPSDVAYAQYDEGGFTSYANCEGSGGFVPLECFRGSRKLADAYMTPELGPFINKLFVGAISLGAILAVLRLAYAGFVYMSSDLPGLKSNSKEIIWDTLLGLFLLLAIYLILKQINPDILNLDVTRNVKTSGQQSGDYSGVTIDEERRAGTFGVPTQPNAEPYNPTPEQEAANAI